MKTLLKRLRIRFSWLALSVKFESTFLASATFLVAQPQQSSAVTCHEHVNISFSP